MQWVEHYNHLEKCQRWHTGIKWAWRKFDEDKSGLFGVHLTSKKNKGIGKWKWEKQGFSFGVQINYKLAGGITSKKLKQAIRNWEQLSKPN